MAGSNSQEMKILEYMKQGFRINPASAEEMFGCRRLASRISDIQKHNPKINIEHHMTTGLNRFGIECRYCEYYIMED